MPFHWIQHRGEQILYVDLSGIGGSGALAAEIGAISDLAAVQPEQSVLALVDLGTRHLTDAGNSSMEDDIPRLAPCVRRAAIVAGGVPGLGGVVLNAIAQLTGREIKLFDAVEPAKDWLARGT